MDKAAYFLLSDTIKKVAMRHQFRYTQDNSVMCSCGWVNDCKARRSKNKRFSGHLASVISKAYLKELEA